MTSYSNWLRVRSRDDKRIREARENKFDDIEVSFRGQLYRAVRTKEFKIVLFRRVEGGGTFAEEWIKHPSKTLAQKAERAFALRDAKIVHDA